jgi:hypothetical protein
MWLALGGGPIIRNGIALLRGLQEHINEHGSVPSAKLDVDVHVAVSFGYAAHQVDEFSLEGLMTAALRRLAIDQGSRDPFTVENLVAYDIRPEDIVGALESPITAIDTLELLRADAPVEEAFNSRFSPVTHVDSGAIEALLLTVGWRRAFGSLDLADPEAFLSLVGRQPALAAEATAVLLEHVGAGLAQADELGYRDTPILVAMPSILLHPDAGELALPNLITPRLDRRQCARTVLLFDTVPPGAGQALRLISDRGVHLAVTAAAAAGTEPGDLFGWPRWAIVFPRHVVQSPSGVDGMTVQQTVSAIATSQTRLIGIADQAADMRDLARHGIIWTITADQSWTAVGESVLSPRVD